MWLAACGVRCAVVLAMFSALLMKQFQLSHTLAKVGSCTIITLVGNNISSDATHQQHSYRFCPPVHLSTSPPVHMSVCQFVSLSGFGCNVPKGNSFCGLFLFCFYFFWPNIYCRCCLQLFSIAVSLPHAPLRLLPLYTQRKLYDAISGMPFNRLQFRFCCCKRTRLPTMLQNTQQQQQQQ